jgi:hypothetical protein
MGEQVFFAEQIVVGESGSAAQQNIPLNHPKAIVSKWWPETGSNRRRRPFQGRALPLSYLALGIQGRCCHIMSESAASGGVPSQGQQLRTSNKRQYSNHFAQRKPRACAPPCANNPVQAGGPGLAFETWVWAR